MSFAAGNAARSATVSLPMGQIAMVGLGFFCITNPEKFFLTLSKGAQFFQAFSAQPNGHALQNQAPQQPIIIHQAAPVVSGSTGSSSMGRLFMKLLMGAGLCWGSYAVLVSVLPDVAKNLLPVNQKVFNRAVTSLGRAIINLKDTLMAQINTLSRKQDDLSAKQDETHDEVLQVKDNVLDVRSDLALVQEALDLCQASLTESERRTSYIARGVQLLTRGVSTILPEDENLLHELVQFNIAGDDFQQPTPLQQRRLQQAIQHIQQQQQPQQGENQVAEASAVLIGVQPTPSSDPENEVPATPAAVEASVGPVHDLLSYVSGTSLGTKRFSVQ
ncbi:expressed unknown protein [Seminavis robusta]|uniref:Uncharacterized protein n=1 Tax=Seminavis robusta TaxID=568900 RepID=A0A9N8HC03_9STRA|nr:expressed unknown protein [Seminavis robusta]|eukprot:Sro299_g111440.1 n/a (331) ;mRNA; r:53414-54406